MNYLVCTVQLDAANYAASVDSKLGYPKAGFDQGGGRHVSALAGATTRYAQLIQHPTLLEWAYPFDPVVQAQAVALPVSGTIQALDATWTPVAQVVG